MQNRSIIHRQGEATESVDARSHPHNPLQTENVNANVNINNNNNSNIYTNNIITTAMSRPSNKRKRISTSSFLPIVPQTNLTEHPVNSINCATKNIVDGDYCAAIGLLTNTLKNIKLILAGDANVTMPTEPEFIRTIDQRSDPNRTGTDRNDGKQEDSLCSKTQGAFEYDFCYSSTSSFLTTSVPFDGCDTTRTVSIFANPLVAKGDAFGVSLDARLCQELSCAAIYNLALAHQLQAIRLFQSHNHVSSSLAYLNKALSLYEYSHDIFKNHDLPLRVPAILCMALVSNLGQIHHLMGNLFKAKQCNEYLLSVLMCTIDRRKDEYLASLQSGDRLMDGFLTIVQHLIISEDCTAPAA